MGAPKSRTGLVASVEVETRDWHAGLSAVRKHAGRADDLPLLSVVHVVVSPDGNLYLSATDRYTCGLAVVSIWDDHMKDGALVEFDLTPQDVSDLQIFKPGKDDNPENRLRLDVRANEVEVTEVAGMVSTEADKRLALPRATFTDPYPDLPKLIARGIREAVALRESAQDRGSASEALLDEVFSQAVLWKRFEAAASAYKAPWVLQRTAEARPAFLVSVGESFVGMLMPLRGDPEDLEKHRGHQRAWLRRLPEPDAEPVSMPEGSSQPDDDDGGPPSGDSLDALVEAGVSAEFADAAADLARLGVTVETRFADLPGVPTPPDTSVTFRAEDEAPLRELAGALRGKGSGGSTR